MMSTISRAYKLTYYTLSDIGLWIVPNGYRETAVAMRVILFCEGDEGGKGRGVFPVAGVAFEDTDA